MKKHIKLYPNGFLFSVESVQKLPEQYSMKKILDKYYYYFDDSIINPYVHETNASFVIIHGHFVHTGLENSIDNKELPLFLLRLYQENYNEFLNTLDFIAGRYVIIIGDLNNVRVYPDASNARSSYYATDRILVASHVNLIADNFNYIEDELHLQLPKISTTFDNSPYINIKSSVPNYFVDLHKNEVARFFPRENNKYKSLEENRKFEIIEHLWKSQLTYYNDNYEHLILSLTGGNDSRISLAMAREYNQKIKFFTYSTKKGEAENGGTFAKVLSIDQFIVKQILQDIPLNHRFFFFNEKKEKLSDNDVMNLNKNTILKHGRYILPYYMDTFPSEKVMHIRANLLEIARRYYHQNIRENSISSVKSTFKYGFRKFYEDVGEEVIDDKLNKSLHNLSYGEDLFDFHILDLFYWEDRMGRWHSEILNETDAAFDTLLPFNVRAIIEVALSFSIPEQKSDYLFKELINRNHPILNFYGRNEKLNLYEKQKKIELRTKSQSKLFSEFKLVDIENQKEHFIQANENTLYIPAENLKKENFSEISFEFKLDKGILMLELHSRFLSIKGKEYLKYEVFKNNDKLLEEDISYWNLINQINILNLKKNDLITIRICALKTAKAQSWQNASRVVVKKYKEVSTKSISSKAITCTSPFSIIKMDSN